MGKNEGGSQQNRVAELGDLSRAVSHALRHEPWLYELELDAEGWASVKSVLIALGKQRAGEQGSGTVFVSKGGRLTPCPHRRGRLVPAVAKKCHARARKRLSIAANPSEGVPDRIR
jgi:hypothetical protein